MKLSTFKTIITEKVNKKSNITLSEGIIDSVVGYIIDKLVKKKTKKYFDELSKDPEFIEAKKRVKQALEDFDQSTDRYNKQLSKFEKEKAEFIKKYGKSKADKVYRGDKYIYGY